LPGEAVAQRTKPTLSSIAEGTVTSPRGFLAGATYAGLKPKAEDSLDLGILYSQVPCTAAGVFTSGKIKAAPVIVCQRHVSDGKAQAIVVNAGCANACTGQQGLDDAAEMAALAAEKLGIAPQQVLVASTGLIGASLPMESIRTGIQAISLSGEGGHGLSTAILTTDTSRKQIAVAVELAGSRFTVAGVAKGAGMIHPNLATLLCFLTTDAAVDAGFLSPALRKAADDSFNMITIDGDTSPNDTVLILANGLAGNEVITEGAPDAEAFQAALGQVCAYLARCIARDGEGATKLIEVSVEGGLTPADARVAARTIASSPLVKAAVHGSDPNWGRIIAALGRSGAEVATSKIGLYLNDVCLMKAGCPLSVDGGLLRVAMEGTEIAIRVCLNLGQGMATAWGCDLSEEYVSINSAYTT
jgi:glutamate N-acetyltransferase/amino-acid N-acetyltransferase